LWHFRHICITSVSHLSFVCGLAVATGAAVAAGEPGGLGLAQQRNLRQLFNYLETEHSIPTPYTGTLNLYTPVKGRPVTLDSGFVFSSARTTRSPRREGTGGIRRRRASTSAASPLRPPTSARTQPRTPRAMGLDDHPFLHLHRAIRIGKVPVPSLIPA
jgi:hypothetical protein